MVKRFYTAILGLAMLWGGTAPASGAEVFAEILPVPKQVYVGQEFEIKIRLWDRIGLLDARFLPLAWKNIAVYPDEAPVERTLKQNGVSYRVQEIRLRAVLKARGIQKFPPLCLAAVVPDRILSGKIDFGEELKPPSEDAFKNVVFSAETKQIRTCSDPFSVEVLPLPAHTPPLFPARRVELLSGVVPDRKDVYAGTPIKRSVVLQAVGTLPGYLPDFSAPPIKGVKIYAGRLENSLSVSGRNLSAFLRRTFVYIPEKPGKLVLPEIAVTWFNTETGQTETSVIPAYEITVMPSSIIGEIQTLRAEHPAGGGFLKQILQMPAQGIRFIGRQLPDFDFYTFLFWTLGAACIVTLSILYVYPHLRAHVRRRRNIRRLYRACLEDDPRKIEKALITWASDTVPHRRILTLFDVLTLFQQEDFLIRTGLDKLNDRLYGMGRFTKFLPALMKRRSGGTLGMEIWAAFEQAAPETFKPPKKRKEDLPGLYPDG